MILEINHNVNASNITFGIQLVITIVAVVVSALGTYFALKIESRLLKQKVETLKADNVILHKRIDATNDNVKENRSKSDDGYLALKEDIHKMETNIIEKINSLKR